MSCLGRWTVLIGMAMLASCPGPGLAKEPVGVVTTLFGQATRAASAAPAAPAPLRFRDSISGADTIRTAERSFVRILLERKAVLTVRELSELRLSENATRRAVDLPSGGIALSVAQARLSPGDVVEVQTPNALAAVRGTASIVVETDGAVTRFHALSGTLDVAARANPIAWQRLQGPASLSVSGGMVGAEQDLDDGTRERLDAAYLRFRVAELGPATALPAAVIEQEQAKAVLLARLIGGDGSEEDAVEMLALPTGPVALAAPGMQSPTQAPVTSPVTVATPTGPMPVLPPLWSWSNQTLAVTGDLHNVPAARADSLGSGLAGATGSAVTVTNEVVDVTGTLTATGAAPLLALQSSTLAARGLAQVQTGSLALAGAPLLEAVGGAVSTTNDLLRVASGGDLVGPATGSLLSLSGTSLDVGNGTGDRLLELTGAGSRVSLTGALLAAGPGGTLATTDDLLNVSAGGQLVGGGAGALLRFTGTTVGVGNGGDQLLQLTGAGSAATLAGGLLDAASTGVALTGSLIDVAAGATLTGTGAGPLAAVSGGSLSLGGAVGFAISSTAGSQIAGSLLRTTGADVTTTGRLLSVSGSLTGTGSAPLLDLTGGAVSVGGGAVVSTANGRLTLGGPALTRSGGTLTTTGDVFAVSGGAQLAGSGTGALLGFSSATVNVGNGGDQLFQLTGAGSAATLAGSVVDTTNSILTLPSGSLVEVSSGATLSAPSSAPLAALSGGALDLGGATGFLMSSTGPSTIGGGLLRSIGADITTTGNLATVSGSLADSGSAALLDLTGGAVAARNAIVISSANGRLTLNGPALERAGGILTTGDDLLSVGAGARLTGTGSGPLLAFSGGAASIGNATADQLFVVSGAGAAATLAGPVLSATGTALTLAGPLVEVAGGAGLTDTAATRLASFSGGSLTLAGGASAFRVNTSGTATLAGGLLDATGTDVTAAGDFVRALGGGRVVVAGPAPLLSLTGGTHQFGATGNIYRLSGTATAVDPVTGLTLATESPLQAAGPLFEAVGATATTQRAVRLDVALLQASAPLLSLRASGAVGSQLTTSSNAIDLTSRARLNATAPVIALDGSRLTVTNASLVNVAGGSYLRVTGNLLSVANGSQLTVNGGVLLFARAGSVVEISGALLSFGGTGSSVTVSNTLCPCATIGGIPVRLSGGALATNVSVTNPVHNAAGNTLSVPAGAAAIRVDGATTRVTISGQ